MKIHVLHASNIYRKKMFKKYSKQKFNHVFLLLVINLNQ